MGLSSRKAKEYSVILVLVSVGTYILSCIHVSCVKVQALELLLNLFFSEASRSWFITSRSSGQDSCSFLQGLFLLLPSNRKTLCADYSTANSQDHCQGQN